MVDTYDFSKISEPYDFSAISAPEPAAAAQPADKTFKQLLEDMLKEHFAKALGTMQGAAIPGYGIAQAGDWLLSKATGRNLQAPKPDPFIGPAAPLEQTPEAAHGRMLGQLGSFLAGGEIAAPEALLGKALTYGGSAALEQPGGPVARGIAGVTAAGASLVPGMAKYIRPKKYMNYILDELSGGKNIGENSKGLAQDIQTAFSKRLTLIKAAYNRIFNVAKGLDEPSQIFQKRFKHYSDYINDYIERGDKADVYKYSSKLKSAHETFMNNPSTENAHMLQSELGTNIRSISAKPNLSIQDGKVLDSLGKTQNFLKKGINNHFNALDPTGNLGQLYKQTGTNYKQEIIPYRDTPAINSLLNGEKLEPTNIQTTFKKPTANINKIAGDIGQEGRNKIIFDKLGKIAAKKSVKSFLNNADKFQSGDFGIEDYASDRLLSQLETLRKANFIKKLAQAGAGATGVGLVAPGAYKLAKGVI